MERSSTFILDLKFMLKDCRIETVLLVSFYITILKTVRFNKFILNSQTKRPIIEEFKLRIFYAGFKVLKIKLPVLVCFLSYFCFVSSKVRKWFQSQLLYWLFRSFCSFKNRYLCRKHASSSLTSPPLGH
jgi:hypothetical protein